MKKATIEERVRAVSCALVMTGVNVNGVGCCYGKHTPFCDLMFPAILSLCNEAEREALERAATFVDNCGTYEWRHEVAERIRSLIGKPASTEGAGEDDDV